MKNVNWGPTHIIGGDVIDGLGGPRQALDVIVDGGRVVDMVPRGSPCGRPPNAELVDAHGLVVTPGFIDLHSHADFRLPEEGAAESALHQGVTTLVTGNCGWSPFPYTGGADLRQMTSILDGGMKWDWVDQTSYYEALQRNGIGVNVAAQVGHSALRIAAMGTAQRLPTGPEQKRMEELIAEAASLGSVGFSTGLIYAPGMYSSYEEVRGLVAETARHDLLYSTHLRNESSDLLTAVTEALRVAEECGVRLQVSHLKAMGPANHGLVEDALELVEGARTRGLDVMCDVYPYTASSTMLSSRLPAWAMNGGPSMLLERLREPSTRRRVSQGLAHRFGRDVDPEGVILVDEDPEISNRSLVDLGEAWNVSPEEAAMVALERRRGTVLMINHAMSERDVRSVLRSPLSIVASDGWVMSSKGKDVPHPRSFGTFARLFSHYVHEVGLLSLEEAVMKVTSLPAGRAGLADRGRLRSGAVADIAVFDPKKITDRSTFSDPRNLASGIEHVLISGRFALKNGRAAQDRVGAVIGHT